MATFQFFDSFKETILEKQVNFAADTLKLMLSNTAPNVSTGQTSADITEITAGNGYPAGGMSLANVTSTQTAGVGKVDADDVSLTASGGSIGPFRYAVLYSSTADRLICYWDLGSSQTLSDGSTRSFIFDSNGIFTVTG
ncbi:MAG: hypothetical protein KatS3mg087_1359 [Patescibacteria group bacterium]|nr:MAG: hypothetical protein KatS3mg087_1359 [Patescibacteria group bacterium]